MITTDKIRETEAFKGLSYIVQKIALSRNNVLNSIDHNVTLIGNIGFEKWDQQTNVKRYNRQIIEELTANGESQRN